MPTKQYCFAPASCRRDPINFCDLFTQKPWWKSHHRDLEWHFLGMACNAVFTDATSITRSKGRWEWDSTVTVGKSRFALWKVLNPTTDVIWCLPEVCSLKAAFSWPLLHYFLSPAAGFNSSNGSPGNKKEMLQEEEAGWGGQWGVTQISIQKYLHLKVKGVKNIHRKGSFFFQCLEKMWLNP